MDFINKKNLKLPSVDFEHAYKVIAGIKDKSVHEWLTNSYDRLKSENDKFWLMRNTALNDLKFYAKLMNPDYEYGDVHMEVYDWLQNYCLYGNEYGNGSSTDKLLMLPRAHLKSHMVATAASWLIARHPRMTGIYMSATKDLIHDQISAIQNILESDKFQFYFPEYIHPDEGKRSKWSSAAINIDHIERRVRKTRDKTINGGSLGTNTTGWHADVIFADDLVVPKNVATEELRHDVSAKMAQISSVRNPGGMTIACGTRYHPDDLYSELLESWYPYFDEETDEEIKMDTWDVLERVVETDGVFLWPRRVAKDGTPYGFDRNTLARIKAGYGKDLMQFFAQYYNDPNDPSSNKVSRDCFRYYERDKLIKRDGSFYLNGKRLKVFAAVDFAYSLSKNADFTAIVVIGMDSHKNVYVIDIDRFKTNKYHEYVRRIAVLHKKWHFRTIRAEVVAAQRTIVEYIKDEVKKQNMYLKVEDFLPPREQTKEMRISAALDYLYEEGKVYHYHGEHISELEDEIVLARPKHDDIADSLATAVSGATPPAKNQMSESKVKKQKTMGQSRFGGSRL